MPSYTFAPDAHTFDDPNGCDSPLMGRQSLRLLLDVGTDQDSMRARPISSCNTHVHFDVKHATPISFPTTRGTVSRQNSAPPYNGVPQAVMTRELSYIGDGERDRKAEAPLTDYKALLR